MALQNFEYPWDMETSMFLLSCHLNALQFLFKVKQLLKNVTQRPAPRQNSYEWQGVCNSMGRYIGQWEPPLFWNFTPEQAQNNEKLL